MFASLSYTRSRSREYGLIGGSQAQSLWPDVVQKDRNDPELGFSRFDQPNKIIAQVAYDTRVFSRNNLTRISLLYIGGEWGRFSYTYSGNFGDGSLRLMYVPSSFEEANLVDRPDLTAQQQWNLLDAYIEQDPYLSKMRGEMTERNGATLPWLHRVDFRIVQDVNLFKGAHKLQLTFDVLNLGNLINSEWGVSQTPIQRSLMRYQGTDANGRGTFTLNNAPGSDAPPTESFRKNIDIGNTWSAQLGVRYTFN